MRRAPPSIGGHRTRRIYPSSLRGKDKMQNVKLTSLLPIIALALCACATPAATACKPLDVPPAKLPPPPAEVMEERPANFQERLVNFFSLSAEKPTKLPGN